MSNANLNNLEKIQGIITKIHNGAKPTWCAGYIQTGKEKEDSVSFSAKFQLTENDSVVLYGRWVDNGKWGKQFDAANFEYNLAPSEEGLAIILEKHPAFFGIGKVRARKIAANCYHDFENILTNNPKFIQDLGGIPEKAILTLQEQWQNYKKANIILIELVTYGLSYAKASQLLEERGESIVSQVRENPYCLIQMVEGLGFKTVDAVALKMGTAKDSETRIRAAIDYSINDSLGFGHCWIEYSDFIDNLQSTEILGLLGEDNKGKIQLQINKAVQENTIVMDFIEDRQITVVAPKWLWEKEMFIIETFNNSIYQLPHKHLIEILENLPENPNFTLNPKQKQSVINSLKYNISLTTGYAGTGKTMSIKRLLDVAEEANLSVALAAPTGKAAKRMLESTGYEAKTIHRLLEFSPEGFKRNASNPFDEDIIILDEVSMISVELFASFLSAVNLHKTRLIMTGDHNQLPPVGAGNILRDLISKQAIPTVILDQVMRNSGDLRINAESIIEKSKLNPTTDKLAENNKTSRNGLKQWYVFDSNVELKDEEMEAIPCPVDDSRNIIKRLEKAFNTGIEQWNLNLLKDVQVIVPTHKSRLGTINLNKALQKVIQKKLYNREIEVKQFGKPEILIGDKVIQRKNNYTLGIMNGSMGIVEEIKINKENGQECFAINFGMSGESDIVLIPNKPEYLENLELAYACSAHSAQGSEWPLVIVIITDKISPMLKHQNWLYTAVTRARESVIILTDQRGAKNAAMNPDKDKRQTFAQFYLKPFVESNTIITPTTTTISSPTLTPIVTPTSVGIDVPTGLNALSDAELREKQKFSEDLKTASDCEPEIISTTNSVLSENQDLEIANLNNNNLQFQNLSIDSPKSQTSIKRINSFSDILAENYPFWDEVVEG